MLTLTAKIEGNRGKIAVKRLNSPSEEAFLAETDVLMRLAPNRTPHLAKLLATYRQPMGRNRGQNDFFLMFECAESNLQRFWGEYSPKQLQHEHADLDWVSLSRWVARQCQGLAQALATLHNLKLKSTESEDARGLRLSAAAATHGLHGDIKPANILRYSNWKDPKAAKDPKDPENSGKPLDGPLGVLQITDFGLSSFHHTQTVENIRMKIGASDYLPPEAHLAYPLSQSLDIWTMGCLFLDFVTWLVGGSSLQEEFSKKRSKYKAPSLALQSQTGFFEVRERKGQTEVSKSKAVMHVSLVSILFEIVRKHADE